MILWFFKVWIEWTIQGSAQHIGVDTWRHKLDNISRDGSILLRILENKVILLTRDNQMKGVAPADDIFVTEA